MGNVGFILKTKRVLYLDYYVLREGSLNSNTGDLYGF